MTRTKIPAIPSTKTQQPAGYVSRQVEVLLRDSSDSGAGPSNKRPRDEVTKSHSKKKKQRTVQSNQIILDKKCSPTSIIKIVEAGISAKRQTLIKKLGLSCVLNLKMKRFDSSLLCWITRLFNEETMSIAMHDGGQLTFTVV
ncbi:unnamed protein product [Linum trigynum]|uniref:Uncharacterized protein n=1 Tax=Linum trigynum TaxID=586398 RepID=A0AAV2GB96_9ROSI